MLATGNSNRNLDEAPRLVSHLLPWLRGESAACREYDNGDSQTRIG